MKNFSKKPVWVEFPLIPWGSIGWRMGHGEVYWYEWADWFRSVSPESQASYQSEWPAPAEWKGFYEFILHGVVPPRIHEKRAQDLEQQPPRPDEHLIDEPNKVSWMARIYLQKTNARGDGVWRIYVDPTGQFWKLGEATSEQRIEPFIWFERFSGNLVGPDNTPESVRTVRGAPVNVPTPDGPAKSLHRNLSFFVRPAIRKLVILGKLPNQDDYGAWWTRWLRTLRRRGTGD